MLLNIVPEMKPLIATMDSNRGNSFSALWFVFFVIIIEETFLLKKYKIEIIIIMENNKNVSFDVENGMHWPFVSR